MLLLVYHKHTQWPGPGRTEQNVVGYPMLPVYTAKAGGFFFIVFGVTALMGGLLTINPVWRFGPYNPSKVTAGSQPDWYMGWPDGALRIMPGMGDPPLGLHAGAGTSSCRSSCCPALMFTILLMLPFLEAVDHRRQARAPPAPASAQRPDAHRADGRADDLLRPAVDRPAATTSSRPSST